MKMKKKRKGGKKSSHTGIKDHYAVICYYDDSTCYTHPFYGTGEQLKEFALKAQKEKDEGKLPERISIELIG